MSPICKNMLTIPHPNLHLVRLYMIIKLFFAMKRECHFHNCSIACNNYITILLHWLLRGREREESQTANLRLRVPISILKQCYHWSCWDYRWQQRVAIVPVCRIMLLHFDSSKLISLISVENKIIMSCWNLLWNRQFLHQVIIHTLLQIAK